MLTGVLLVVSCRSAVGVRESQGLTRIPDTLTVAMEFITMPTLQEQLPALEELRKQTLRCASNAARSTCWTRRARARQA